MAQSPHATGETIVRIRRLDRYLAAYNEHHEKSLNQAIHYVAIPMICWSIFAGLAALPFPAGWEFWPGLGWATVGAIVASLYYFTFSKMVGLGAAVSLAIYLLIIAIVDHAFETPLWLVALSVFALAWVLQFIGHKIEGKKPKFFDDLRYLLIGPIWVLVALYRLFGIRY